MDLTTPISRSSRFIGPLDAVLHAVAVERVLGHLRDIAESGSTLSDDDLRRAAGAGCVRLDAGWSRRIIRPTAPSFSQLGFAAPARETSESPNGAIGLGVRSHTFPRRGRTSIALHSSMIEDL